MKNGKKKFASKRLELKHKCKLRIRDKVTGDAKRPRLSVFKSAKHVSCQIIDDSIGKTLVSASSYEAGNKLGQANKDICFAVGQAIAKRCLEKKVTKIVFDRNGYLYHGRVEQLAKGARDGGLSF